MKSRKVPQLLMNGPMVYDRQLRVCPAGHTVYQNEVEETREKQITKALTILKK